MKNTMVISLLASISIFSISQSCETYQCDSIKIREIYIAFGGDSSVDVSPWFPKNERITEISFSCNLDTFPSQIGELTALKRLDIHSQKMKYLPSSIGNLTNLERLDLSDNQLEELPNEIGKLVNLKELRLDRNNLRMLPDSIVYLQNIEYMYDAGKYYCSMNDNYLCSLPDPVAQWADKYCSGWYLDQKEPCNRSGVIITPEIKGADISGNRHNEPKYLFTLRGTRIRNAKGISGVKSMPPGCYIISAGKGRYMNVHVKVR